MFEQRLCWFCGRHPMIENAPGLCEHCSAAFVCAQLSPWTFSIAAYMVRGMHVYGAVQGSHEAKIHEVNRVLEQESGLVLLGRVKE